MKCKDCKEFNRLGQVLGYCRKLDKLTAVDDPCEIERRRLTKGLDVFIILLIIVIGFVILAT